MISRPIFDKLQGPELVNYYQSLAAPTRDGYYEYFAQLVELEFAQREIELRQFDS